MHTQVLVHEVTPEDLRYIVAAAVEELIIELLDHKSTPQSRSPELLTRAEAASLLRISIATLHRAVKSGQLVPNYVGRRVLFTHQALEAWIGICNGNSQGSAK
ncbi:MAG: helix-turn-helix domain-containing protein [Ignavibacteria bacterium]|nr:helix-turn-helix domain-containing protein [Ignavibacteria bacterium]